MYYRLSLFLKSLLYNNCFFCILGFWDSYGRPQLIKLELPKIFCLFTINILKATYKRNISDLLYVMMPVRWRLGGESNYKPRSSPKLSSYCSDGGV